MPAAGLPVASITISTSLLAIAASGSSKTQVVPCLAASAMAGAANRSTFQPTCARRSRALGGQINHGHEVNARRAARLGKEHRAELAGPDQGEAQGPFRGGALSEQSVQIHGHPVSSSDRFMRLLSKRAAAVLPGIENKCSTCHEVPRVTGHNMEAVAERKASVEPSRSPKTTPVVRPYGHPEQSTTRSSPRSSRPRSKNGQGARGR